MVRPCQSSKRTSNVPNHLALGFRIIKTSAWAIWPLADLCPLPSVRDLLLSCQQFKLRPPPSLVGQVGITENKAEVFFKTESRSGRLYSRLTAQIGSCVTSARAQGVSSVNEDPVDDKLRRELYSMHLCTFLFRIRQVPLYSPANVWAYLR